MIGDNDKGQTRSEWWLSKIYPLVLGGGGSAFYGTVTTATSTTQFKVDSLKGLGTNLLNDAYYCQVIEADAAAPEGEIQKISAYTTADGNITVGTAFTVAPAVGDYVLILHESVAKMFLIADGTGDYPASVVDNSILGHLLAKTGVVANYNDTTDSLEAISDKVGAFTGDGGADQDDSVKASLDLAHIDLDAIIANQAGAETISSYNLPNDVVENTLLEIVNTKRLRLDAVWLDMVNLVQDVTIKVYHKIDGTNYRQYDVFTWGTSEENGVLLSPVTINGDWKITVTSTVAQGAIKAIPYNIIKTTMEA